MSTTSSPKFGKFGQALYFDGTNDYVNIGNNFDFNIATTRTFTAWIKPERTIPNPPPTEGTPRYTPRGPLGVYWYNGKES